MSFQMTEEQRMATDGLRKFLDKKIEPEFIAHGEGRISKEQMLKWTKELASFGLVNTPIPEKFGGMGMDWVTHLRLWEEVGVTSMDIAIPLLINVAGADLLVHNAPKHIQDKYLPGILNGKMFIALGISEPDVGSDVAAVKTQAIRDGDDWVINGEKTWISNGEYMDIFVCTCKTGEGKLTHIAIDGNHPGLDVRHIPKMALNGQSTSQIFLTDVRVPIADTVGEIGKALMNTLVTFERARCHMAAWGYSLGRRALEESIKYSQERIQHGKPIAGHQLIAEKIAIMATEVDAARLLTLRAADMIDKGIRCDKEASMAKWYGTEIGLKAARQAVQIHGGNGVTTEFIVERLAREAMIGPIPDGTTEIQKLIISRALTGVQPFR